MQRLHSPSSMVSVLPSQLMHLVGQRSTTSALMSMPPAAYPATSAWSTRILPFQVPTMARSERATEATQSLAQPLTLILNLYGHMGR